MVTSLASRSPNPRRGARGPEHSWVLRGRPLFCDSANMTGNISALSDHVGIGELVPAAVYLALIGTFISGTIVSTLLVNAGRRRRL